VPKSKLRKPEQPVLGKQYTGTAVSRKTLFDNEGEVQEVEEEAEAGDDDDEDQDEDPFARTSSGSSVSSVSSVKSREMQSDGSEGEEKAATTDLRAGDLADADGDDSEIDSDDAFGSGEEEVFKSKGFTFRGSRQDLVAEDSAEDGNSDEDGALVWDTEDEEEVASAEDFDMSDGASDSDQQSQDLSGNDSDSNSDSTTSPQPSRTPTTGREKLKDLLTSDAAAVASTLTASANADGQKGRAVKHQYQTFDRLLDARIKLQKGLTAANNISLTATPDPEIVSAAQAAEVAALKLFSTIESLRQDISEAASGITSKKRKRQPLPIQATPTNTLWTRLSALEDQSLAHRRAILNKWSSKTRAANNISAPRSQLDRNTHQDTMTSILDAQLVSSNQQAQTNPRFAYDDTPFYQSLLRDLIASRASLSQSQNIVLDIPLVAAPKQHRKGVDLKASKGRKVRYTVQEKLQNFMAEEERGTWTDGARREFFASLFGGQEMLDEDGGEVDAGEAGEEGVLRLFRN
jgi:protein AATF/BFR2